MKDANDNATTDFDPNAKGNTTYLPEHTYQSLQDLRDALGGDDWTAALPTLLVSRKDAELMLCEQSGLENNEIRLRRKGSAQIAGFTVCWL